MEHFETWTVGVCLILLAIKMKLQRSELLFHFSMKYTSLEVVKPTSNCPLFEDFHMSMTLILSWQMFHWDIGK